MSRLPAPARWTRRLADAEALDPAVSFVEPKVRAAFGTGRRGALLRGDWLGHALHPVLTDLTLGSWTSATLLDLTGGAEARGSARRLVGAGLVVVGPTAWSGWADWSADDRPRPRRVGLVHAATNGLAAATYAASYLARRRGDHDAGVRLALAGAAITTVGGYLGGHLAEARATRTEL